MNDERRGWRGRAAQPVRDRWRDRWEASPSWSARPGHGLKVPPEGSSAGRAPVEAIEARAGALFAQAVQRDPLPQHKLIAIAGRLRHRATRRRAPRRSLVVRLAAGLSLLIVGAAVAATATHYFHVTLPFGRSSPAPSSAPRQSPPAPLHGRPLAATAPAERPAPVLAAVPLPVPAAVPLPDEVPAAPPPEEAPPARPSRTTPQHRPAPLAAFAQPSTTSLAVPAQPSTTSLAVPAQPSTASLAVPAPPSTASLAEEARLITAALTALRRRGDTTGALATLDQHDLRFPRGELAEEATLARVEALVKVQRSGEALALLEARGPVRRGGNQRKLLLTRAELRAAAGRCATALGELDALLGGDPPADSLTERALWGRAACRASGGMADLARADLATYLKMFPSGHFAAGARAALTGDGRRPRP